MGYSELENGSTLGTIRGQLNSQLSELFQIKVESSQVLTLTRTLPFTPTGDYHPATKLYADGLYTSWEAIFNPQGIQADIFDRANHTGSIPATVIEWDTDNRTVTDDEKAYWNQKEDAIGAKGTAFNKQFGTTAGTVAAGDHTHTSTDVGLGNVDNTSDVGKPISDATQVVLDGKLDNTLADLTPQTIEPAHAEGRVFYDEITHTLSVKSDISGVTFNLGQEEYIRVINRTGATIVGGKPCRSTNVDPVVRLPSVALAQADSFSHAKVLGVSTHNIGVDEEGWLVRAGRVRGNFSYLTLGVPVFLSATEAGGLVSTSPPIATQVGGLLDNNVDGSIMVRIDNNVSFPTLFAVFQEVSDTFTLPGAATWEDINNYQSSSTIGVTIDAAAGTMLIPNTGWYRMTITMTVTLSSASPGGDAILFRLRNTTEETTLSSIQLTADSSNLTVSRSAAAPFYVEAGDTVVVQVGSVDNSSDLTFDGISIDMESINVK